MLALFRSKDLHDACASHGGCLPLYIEDHSWPDKLHLRPPLSTLSPSGGDCVYYTPGSTHHPGRPVTTCHIGPLVCRSRHGWLRFDTSVGACRHGLLLEVWPRLLRWEIISPDAALYSWRIRCVMPLGTALYELHNTHDRFTGTLRLAAFPLMTSDQGEITLCVERLPPPRLLCFPLDTAVNLEIKRFHVLHVAWDGRDARTSPCGRRCTYTQAPGCPRIEQGRDRSGWGSWNASTAPTAWLAPVRDP